MTRRRKTKPQLSLWAKLPQWAWQQGLRTNVDFAAHPDSASAPIESQRQPPEVCKDIKQAQVITSAVEYPQVTQMHKPVLDIDFPVQCVPSTTPGHFHLFMDKELEWDAYRKLLDALADAGIIESGYRSASIARRYTSVRLPWVKKPAQEPPTEVEAAAVPAPAAEAPQEQPAPMPPIDTDFRFGIDPGAPVTIAPRPSVHAPASPWSAPGADPLGDIIEAADRMRRAPLVPNNRPITQNFGPTPSYSGVDRDGTRWTSLGFDPAETQRNASSDFTLHYDAMRMTYRDSAGRTLTEHAIRRGCEVLGINRDDLSGPRMEEVWTRLLNAQHGYEDERARIANNRPRPSFRGATPNISIVDEVAMDASFAADRAERILQQERVDAANAAVEATVRPSRMNRLRDSIMNNLATAYAPTFATRAAMQAEDDAVRARIMDTPQRPPPLL